MKKAQWRRVLISTLLGITVGFVMCYIAWQHNPQCEYHCDDTIHWTALASLWFAWFGLTSIISLLLLNTLAFFNKHTTDN